MEKSIGSFRIRKSEFSVRGQKNKMRSSVPIVPNVRVLLTEYLS